MVGNVHFQKSSRFAVSFVFALMCFLTSASAASVEKDASLVPDSHAKPKPPVTTIVSAARREIPISVMSCSSPDATRTADPCMRRPAERKSGIILHWNRFQ